MLSDFWPFYSEHSHAPSNSGCSICDVLVWDVVTWKHEPEGSLDPPMGSQHINKNPPITQTNIQTPGITKNTKTKVTASFHKTLAPTKQSHKTHVADSCRLSFFFVCLKPLHGTALRFFWGGSTLEAFFSSFSEPLEHGGKFRAVF